MARLRETRYKLQWVLGALLLLDVVAVIVLLSPLAGAGAVRQQEFEEVRRQVQSRLKTVVPPNKVQERVEEARKQMAGFYADRIPSAMSEISRQLGDVAAQSGVSLLSANYETEEADLPGLQRVQINANLTGDYLQEVKFINSMERQKLFFIVDGVTLGASEAGKVRLAVTLETYLKN